MKPNYNTKEEEKHLQQTQVFNMKHRGKSKHISEASKTKPISSNPEINRIARGKNKKVKLW